MASFFQNKVVIVTGGTEGIGKALVNTLLDQGAKVATCGRNQDKLYRLQMQFPGKPLHTVVADVSNYEDCQNLVHSTLQTYGGIDILINNAGITMRSLMEDTDVSVIRRVMEVNFFGAVYCTKLALVVHQRKKRYDYWDIFRSRVSRITEPQRLFCFQICLAGMAGGASDRNDGFRG